MALNAPASTVIPRLPRAIAVAVGLWAGLLAALAAGPALAQADGMRVRFDAVRRGPLSPTVPVIGRLVALQAVVVLARLNGPG